jgi:hypothetical protein
MTNTEIMLRPDAKGRVTLGKLAEGISSFRASQNPDGSIVLKPYVEIALQDSWLVKNPKAMKSVRKGLDDLKRGHVHDLGDFSSFINDDDEAAA